MKPDYVPQYISDKTWDWWSEVIRVLIEIGASG